MLPRRGDGGSSSKNFKFKLRAEQSVEGERQSVPGVSRLWRAIKISFYVGSVSCLQPFAQLAKMYRYIDGSRWVLVCVSVQSLSLPFTVSIPGTFVLLSLCLRRVVLVPVATATAIVASSSTFSSNFSCVIPRLTSNLLSSSLLQISVVCHVHHRRCNRMVSFECPALHLRYLSHSKLPIPCCSTLYIILNLYFTLETPSKCISNTLLFETLSHFSISPTPWSIRASAVVRSVLGFTICPLSTYFYLYVFLGPLKHLLWHGHQFHWGCCGGGGKRQWSTGSTCASRSNPSNPVLRTRWPRARVSIGIAIGIGNECG